MYVAIDPKVSEHVAASERLKRVQAVARHLEAQFPWGDAPHKVAVSAGQVSLTWLGPLDAERVAWLNASSDVSHWSYQLGGSLTLPEQQVTLETYPCTFQYEAHANGAQICAQLDLHHRIGNYLHLSGGPGIRLTTEKQLESLLTAVGLPREGWTRSIWLCERCDQPGATQSHFKCPDCQSAYEAFMLAPLTHLVEVQRT